MISNPYAFPNSNRPMPEFHVNIKRPGTSRPAWNDPAMPRFCIPAYELGLRGLDSGLWNGQCGGPARCNIRRTFRRARASNLSVPCQGRFVNREGLGRPENPPNPVSAAFIEAQDVQAGLLHFNRIGSWEGGRVLKRTPKSQAKSKVPCGAVSKPLAVCGTPPENSLARR